MPESDWTRVDRRSQYRNNKARRTKPCVSRRVEKPDDAYICLPDHMVTGTRVSIYAGKNGKIAFEFDASGDYGVTRSNKGSTLLRVTIPKALAHLIPLGRHDVELEVNSEGWLILDATAHFSA